jgi:ABC-type polysaccharide/polyol phosphate export permease
VPFQFGISELGPLILFAAVIWLFGWLVYRVIRKAVADGVRDGRS